MLKISFSVDLVNYACSQPGDATEMMTAEMDLMKKIVRNNYFYVCLYFSLLYLSLPSTFRQSFEEIGITVYIRLFYTFSMQSDSISCCNNVQCTVLPADNEQI